MKKLLAALKRAPRRAAGLAVVVAAVAVPAGLLAWGPERPTFTLEEPADYVTFNSITNNAKHGDERNFVQIRNATDGGQFGEEVQIEPGKEYEVYAFYHNNAKSKLNESGEGIARNAQMRVQMPADIKQGEKARVTGFVSADNAQPQTVWDEAYGVNNSNGGVALRYVQDSATLTNADAQGNNRTFPVSEELLTTGIPLGWDQMDGNLPGCNEYSGYVKYRFKAVQPNFDVTKEVSKHGQNDYSKSVAVNDGETVDYKIQYKNTGDTKQSNVVIKDELPKGVTYIPGSTHVATSETNGQWKNIQDDTVVTTGINIGSYVPGGNAYVKFSAKIDKLDELDCGPNKLTNVARAETDNGSKSDNADVTINKECEEQPEKIKVCELESKNIITIDEKDFDASKHSKNLEDCKETPAPEKIEVCDLESKTIITINKDEYDESKHSTNLQDCEETPTTPETPMCEVPGKEHLPKDSPECVEAPAELPETGGTGVLSVLGLGAMTISAGYYVASRRILN
ncbi:MAG: LPXTG cell wall anchor domain-containing protein [Candidatus Saccharimonadales bacterium]